MNEKKIAVIVPAYNEELLIEKTLNSIPNFTKLNQLPSFTESVVENSLLNFVSEDVHVKELDYFFTNAISRSSKTMSECRQIKRSPKKTGTDNL